MGAHTDPKPTAGSLGLAPTWVSIACPPRASMPIKGGCCSADRGTWTFRAGTGVHAGFSGGGAFAAVGLQSGIVVARQEGYLTKR